MLRGSTNENAQSAGLVSHERELLCPAQARRGQSVKGRLCTRLIAKTDALSKTQPLLMFASEGQANRFVPHSRPSHSLSMFDRADATPCFSRSHPFSLFNRTHQANGLAPGSSKSHPFSLFNRTHQANGSAPSFSRPHPFSLFKRTRQANDFAPGSSKSHPFSLFNRTRQANDFAPSSSESHSFSLFNRTHQANGSAPSLSKYRYLSMFEPEAPTVSLDRSQPLSPAGRPPESLRTRFCRTQEGILLLAEN